MRISAESKRTMVRLALEIALYGLLVVIYLFVILNFFGPDLVVLFKQNPVLYAALALGLMAFQGIFLETVTTFLIDRLEL